MHGGDPWAQRDSRGVLRRQARTLLAGQLTRPVEVVPRGNARVAGAHLRPHGAYALLRVAQHQYRNRVVDLRTIDRELAMALETTVVPCEDPREMVDALAQALAARASAQTTPCAATTASTAALALKGMIGVGDLARMANISERQLERLFHQRFSAPFAGRRPAVSGFSKNRRGDLRNLRRGGHS